MRREPEVAEVEVPVVDCLDGPSRDYLKGTCTNSFCEKWHPFGMLVLQDQERLQIWREVLFAHRQERSAQPSKQVHQNDDKSAVAMLKKMRTKHLKWTVFAVQKCAEDGLQERIDDRNIQSDNKYKSGLKVKIP